MRFTLTVLKPCWRNWLLLPVSPLLYMLVVHNFHKREKGLAPDEWYWADRILFWGGLAVKENKET